MKRRKATVFAVLHSDPRFEQTGRRRASHWSVAVRSFDAMEAAARWDCDPETAGEIIFGPEGFLELGLVASLNGNGRVFVTGQGREAAALLGGLSSEAAS